MAAFTPTETFDLLDNQSRLLNGAVRVLGEADPSKMEAAKKNGTMQIQHISGKLLQRYPDALVGVNNFATKEYLESVKKKATTSNSGALEMEDAIKMLAIIAQAPLFKSTPVSTEAALNAYNFLKLKDPELAAQIDANNASNARSGAPSPTAARGPALQSAAQPVVQKVPLNVAPPQREAQRNPDGTYAIVPSDLILNSAIPSHVVGGDPVNWEAEKATELKADSLERPAAFATKLGGVAGTIGIAARLGAAPLAAALTPAAATAGAAPGVLAGIGGLAGTAVTATAALVTSPLVLTVAGLAFVGGGVTWGVSHYNNLPETIASRLDSNWAHAIEAVEKAKKGSAAERDALTAMSKLVTTDSIKGLVSPYANNLKSIQSRVQLSGADFTRSDAATMAKMFENSSLYPKAREQGKGLAKEVSSAANKIAGESRLKDKNQFLAENAAQNKTAEDLAKNPPIKKEKSYAELTAELKGPAPSAATGAKEASATPPRPVQAASPTPAPVVAKAKDAGTSATTVAAAAAAIDKSAPAVAASPTPAPVIAKAKDASTSATPVAATDKSAPAVAAGPSPSDLAQQLKISTAALAAAKTGSAERTAARESTLKIMAQAGQLGYADSNTIRPQPVKELIAKVNAGQLSEETLKAYAPAVGLYLTSYSSAGPAFFPSVKSLAQARDSMGTERAPVAAVAKTNAPAQTAGAATPVSQPSASIPSTPVKSAEEQKGNEPLAQAAPAKPADLPVGKRSYIDDRNNYLAGLGEGHFAGKAVKASASPTSAGSVGRISQSPQTPAAELSKSVSAVEKAQQASPVVKAADVAKVTPAVPELAKPVNGARAENKPAEAGPAVVKVAEDPSPSPTAGQYHTVKQGESLWKIVSDMNMKGKEREDYMGALQALNKDKFNKAGYSVLAVGAVLKLPTVEEIGTLNPDAGDRMRAYLAQQDQQPVKAANIGEKLAQRKENLGPDIQPEGPKSSGS